MSDTLRAFWAVSLPLRTRALARRITEPLREQVEGVRWVPEENLHLTLKFLGELESDRVPRLLQLAQAKLIRFEPFPVVIGGPGAFPNAAKARVVWLDITAGATSLAKIARKLDAASTKVGVERERRPYRAHLTVGRLREPRAVPIAAMALPAQADPEDLSFSVEEVVLYESRLSSTGAHYVPLAHLPLAKGEDLDRDGGMDAFDDPPAPDY